MSTPDGQTPDGHSPPTYVDSSQIESDISVTDPEKDPQTHIVEVAPVDTAKVSEYEPKKSKSLKSRILFWFSWLAGVLWLAPIGFLLYANVSRKVIGASAWCPFGNCTVITYRDYSSYGSNIEESTYTRAAALSDHDGNLNGALQFVAKVLEVWFIALAASLVYTLSRILASKPGGLPLGHLLIHVEFADILNLANSSLYNSVKRQKGPKTRKSHRKLFILFVTTIVFLCILANLMGPTTAVLLLPQLDPDYTTENITGKNFLRMRSEFGPGNGNSPTGALTWCLEDHLLMHNYSCFRESYGSTLDAITEGTLAYLGQTNPNSSLEVLFPDSYSPTVENYFPFSFNTSDSKDKTTTTSWATNRQVIREISEDFGNFSHAVMDNSTTDKSYEIPKKALSVILQREGPIIGVESLPTYGDISIITIDDNRTVRCISEYQPDNNWNWYSKCFRTGSGWGNSTSWAEEYIFVDPDENDTITVLSYWSDKSAYFLGDGLASWNDCFSQIPLNTTALTFDGPADCDWESMFNQELPANFPPTSPDAFVLEFWNFNPSEPQVLISEFHPVAGVASYSVDVTHVYPQVSEVKLERIPNDNDTTPIVINPQWFLATWGIDASNSSLQWNDDLGGYVIYSNGAGPLASSAGKLKASVNAMYDTDSFDPDLMTPDEMVISDSFGYLVLNIVLETLSLITYDTTDDEFPDDQKSKHPAIVHNMKLKVWRWGADSRTIMLGLVVASIGCAVVIVRAIVLLFNPEPKSSTVGIIASLMEHAEHGELKYVPQKERKAAGMVRFNLQEVDEDKIMFRSQ